MIDLPPGISFTDFVEELYQYGALLLPLAALGAAYYVVQKIMKRMV